MALFSMIYCCSLDNFIATTDGEIPHSKIDKAFFNRTVMYSPNCKPNYLVAGKKTYDTLPPTLKKLTFVFESIESSYRFAVENKDKYYKFFVIGGAKTYKQFFDANLINEVFEARMNIVLCEGVKLDQFDFFKYNRESNSCSDDVNYQGKVLNLVGHHFNYYKLRPQFENEYLELIKRITENGVDVDTRNGRTRSVQDVSFKIDLRDGFPILTIRKSFFECIVEELLWMISGSTNANKLKEKKVHIWDYHSSRAYLDSVNLNNLSEGDIGPSYGFQLRHYGEPYFNSETQYFGFDQLRYCINLIKNNPSSRRILINLWNPSQINEMALPPCHLLYQFTVIEGKLNCHLYQRSWDILLGWNTSTAALLTNMIAKTCDLEIGTLTHTICDVHIYHNNLDKVNEIIRRIPYTLPYLCVRRKDNIEDYTSNDFELIGYKYHPAIKINMS